MTENSASLSLEQQKSALEPLVEALRKAKTIPKKIALLSSFQTVSQDFKDLCIQFPALAEADEIKTLCVKSMIAIDQHRHIFKPKFNSQSLENFFNDLIAVETFYQETGGIVGYHLTVISLILEQQNPPKPIPEKKYHQPSGLDFTQETRETRQAIRHGVEHMHTLGEIYPVGGAGERLNLSDEKTAEPLPVAQLLFAGRTLLEGLFRDLQAREYLHYKLCRKQLNTPVAMMTSTEKNNHQHIREICERNNWFNRQEQHLFWFIQPLVPVITIDGRWSLKGPFALNLKPGGHGVIWKLAKNHTLFDWFRKKQRHRALIRQINNPLAGTDHTLLGFLGVGCNENKSFGFASCNRLLNTSEGMNVVIEEKIDDTYCYCTTNIEYTEFKKHGLKDVPHEEGSAFSVFPANTNILFADLNAIEKIVDAAPLPGQLINMKSKISVENEDGSIQEIHAGRLETTMQNIADFLIDCFPQRQTDFSKLKTYLTFHERAKTISVTKHSLRPNGSPAETPEKCYYDLLLNMHHLFTHYCEMELPLPNSLEAYLAKGPSFIVQLHPAIGPLFSIIGQKIRRGKLFPHSELILEIAEIEIQNLQLNGSLRIFAENITGTIESDGTIRYSEQTGKCILKNVHVTNRGIDRKQPNIYWKNEIHLAESMQIIINGNGEFIAEDVTFEGNIKLEVPDGHCMRITLKNGRLDYQTTKITKPSWHWAYSWDSEDRICLTKKTAQ